MPRKTKEPLEKIENSTKKSKNTTSLKKEVTQTYKATKKATTSKKTTSKASPKKNTSKKKFQVVEYYDLPYRYNQTVVKVLAQTPTTLFVYWDISDEDKKSYQKQYGEDFFETTKPILVVYNDSMHYQFEIEINDFANSWYLQVDNSLCNYHIELARRPISENISNKIPSYISVSTSNEIEIPNDKILLKTFPSSISFQNVKNHQIKEKKLSELKLPSVLSKQYKKFYPEENIELIYEHSNPSSDTFSKKF